jgi:DNA-directed RNA polymerase specialized sigma24 family protein
MRGQDKHIGDDIPSHHPATIDEEQIRAVYQLMYRYVGNREDAESLTERACIQALREARGLPGGRNLQEILWQTAESVAAEHLRWLYGSFEQPDKETHASEQANAPTLVRSILESLTGRERDFLTRRFLDNGSLAETAAILHLTVNEALAVQWYALTQAAHVTREETPCCSPC